MRYKSSDEKIITNEVCDQLEPTVHVGGRKVNLRRKSTWKVSQGLINNLVMKAYGERLTAPRIHHCTRYKGVVFGLTFRPPCQVCFQVPRHYSELSVRPLTRQVCCHGKWKGASCCRRYALFVQAVGAV
jgi:hypothetical protein